ncbi:MAG: site-specific integrase [Dehalococcoidia bacterium]
MSRKPKSPTRPAGPGQGTATFRGPSIYWRNGRAYGDFRPYRDVGGGREALKEPGRAWATQDPEAAMILFTARLQELQDKRRGRIGLPVALRVTRLDHLVRDHLEKKRRAGGTSESHLRDLEHRLRVAVAHFGPERDPRTMEADDVRKWAEVLAKGGRRNPGTVRHYLNALSGLYRRAVEGRFAERNPVAELMEKPTGKWKGEAAFLEVAEAARLLEAARTLEDGGRQGPGIPGNRINATHGLFPIIATFLLTGGRKSEVVGLELGDVDFRQGLVHFRPNGHRGLKTRTSVRSVPLWPQLREILGEWLEARPPSLSTDLLFPSQSGGMVRDLRKSLDAMAAVAGMQPGEVRTRRFRHTYCSARLQTVQRILKSGADPTDPEAWEYVEVSKFQVQREMGHGGSQLVDRIYGHAQRTPHRSEVVEYRV